MWALIAQAVVRPHHDKRALLGRSVGLKKTAAMKRSSYAETGSSSGSEGGGQVTTGVGNAGRANR
jgi:hypothetical protein